MDAAVPFLVATATLVGAYLVGRGLFELGWNARHRAEPGGAHRAPEDKAAEGARSGGVRAGMPSGWPRDGRRPH